MKASSGAILIVLASLLAGCATSSVSRYYPSRDEQAVFAITQLYECSRAVRYTNGIQEYALVPEAAVVSACQTLLLRYSESDRETVRLAAACRLAHFGTMPAFERCLRLARSEESPEARADLWSAIIELLQPPASWSDPQVTVMAHDGDATSTGRLAQVAQVLSSPELRIVISCWPRPDDFILPPGLEASRLRDEIFSQYRNDDGSWTVQVVDRIPFVPFSERRRTVTRTVREAMAESLQECALGDPPILAAFQAFSKDPNDAVSGPAREVVEALTEAGEPLEERGRARASRLPNVTR